MNPALTAFVDECRADRRLTASTADAMEEAFEALHREGDDNGDAMELLDAIRWIVRQPRSIEERMRAINTLLELSGKVAIPSLRRFLKWDS
jgi:hypothetical protein